MQDYRIKFLTKETQEVINSLVGLSQKLITGLDLTPCFFCKSSFKNLKSNNPFIFIIIQNFFTIKNDNLKFCCLKCCKTSSEELLDVIELYPTLKLHAVKKLMYFNIIKKFVFNFEDSKTILYKKYAITNGLHEAIAQMMQEKKDNDEIQTVRLLCDKHTVAEDNVFSMRIDYGREYNFDLPLALNEKMRYAVQNHCSVARYSLEVFYKVYNKYEPFLICYNQNNQKECQNCTNKICPQTGHSIFYCSLCGLTDPNYYKKQYTMMYPFWKKTYAYNKVYWRSIKSKRSSTVSNIMLYAVDTRRTI